MSAVRGTSGGGRQWTNCSPSPGPAVTMPVVDQP